MQMIYTHWEFSPLVFYTIITTMNHAHCFLVLAVTLLHKEDQELILVEVAFISYKLREYMSFEWLFLLLWNAF